MAKSAAKRRPARRSPPARRRRATTVATGVAALIVTTGLIAAVALAGGGSNSSNSGGKERGRRGETAPSTKFETLNGSEASLADYRGKPLVVNFFASWCAPCLRELPGFEQVHRRLSGQVGFVGLNLQDSVDNGRRLVEQTGITYDTGRDPDGVLFQALGGIGMPTTVLVDRNGRIVDVHTGEITAAALEAKIHQEVLLR